MMNRLLIDPVTRRLYERDGHRLVLAGLYITLFLLLCISPVALT